MKHSSRVAVSNAAIDARVFLCLPSLDIDARHFLELFAFAIDITFAVNTAYRQRYHMM